MKELKWRVPLVFPSLASQDEKPIPCWRSQCSLAARALPLPDLRLESLLKQHILQERYQNSLSQSWREPGMLLT